jgi:hypothetical protein
VDQFIPEASPVIAKSGELVVEAEPLVKLGGDPVASNVDSRFDALVGLEMILDMRLNILVQKPAILTKPRHQPATVVLRTFTTKSRTA